MKMRIAAGVLVSLAGTAAAQPLVGTTTDVEVPTIVLDQGDQATAGGDEGLDLANIVQSAAKGVTTVQEAPAIVTVITPDEIRDRQFQNLDQLYDTAPGWNRASLAFNTFPSAAVRGQIQAVQFLHDGLSMFDPGQNVPTTNRTQPMELIKRVEMITGPGGVLWGSNSLLGILNVITKDAEDVEGVEVGGTVGDGRGDRMMGRAYVMAGKSDLADGKVKAFVHGSVETFKGAEQTFPILLYHAALPQPNSANVYGPLVASDQAQSMIATLDGKLTYGDLQLRVFFPFGRRYNPAALSANPSRQNLPEDSRCATGVNDPACDDPLHTSRLNRQDMFDRYAVLEYRHRFAKDRAGISARTYFIQFERGFTPLQVLAPSSLIRGGLAFTADLTTYRSGAQLDGDVELAHPLRVQYGAEVFREWKLDTSGQSIQGAGTGSTLQAPYDLTRLPLLCPRIFDQTKMAIVPIPGCPLTFGFPADRVVIGAYVNPQYRPNKKLIFDAGARLQAAPEALGKISYPLTATLAATMVWNFIPNWHVKLNYAQGFRPPVFNNTTSNGEAVNIGGNPNLNVETSDATQVEVNARIFKGQRRVRELSFRVDGSYTRLNDLIQINTGKYSNSGTRGIMSGEFLGKLYVQGGHRLELGYTWLRVDTSDKGLYKAIPEHWFNFATVFNLVTNKLGLTTNIKVSGAAEDPNRLVEYRNSRFDAMGVPLNPVSVEATDMVMDRIPPTAELSLGMIATPTPKLTIKATVYDALFGHFYQSDVLYDYEPHLEYVPSPQEGFKAYISAMYQY